MLPAYEVVRYSGTRGEIWRTISNSGVTYGSQWGRKGQPSNSHGSLTWLVPILHGGKGSAWDLATEQFVTQTMEYAPITGHTVFSHMLPEVCD